MTEFLKTDRLLLRRLRSRHPDVEGLEGSDDDNHEGDTDDLLNTSDDDKADNIMILRRQRFTKKKARLSK